MQIKPFATEHFFEKYEFSTPYQLCNSDCETVSVEELLELAGIPLSKLGELTLGYTQTQGHPALRKRIAVLYESIRPEQVVVLGSPVEGIYLAARALLEPGDEVICLSPAYDALVNLFEHVVGTDSVKKWSFTPTTSGWELDLDQLAGLISSRTRLLVINFPHNPTGFLPTPSQFAEVIMLAEAHDIRVFSDEMYAGLVHSGSAPIASAADLSRRAVVLSGLSKTYGLPGLRTGWLVVPDAELRQYLMNWKFYTSICPAAPSEFLAMAALSVREQLLRKNLDQIERNLAVAEAFFGRWPDLFTWRRPLAGSTALVGMEVPSVSALSADLAETAGVLIHPATTLGASDQQMRMGFGRAGFAEALEHFERYLANHSVA